MYLYNTIIIPLYFLSIIFSLSSNSWITIWMGMEMNLLTFIFIILKSNLTVMNMESTMKYFLIQSMGSLIFMLTINSNMIFYNETPYIFALVPSLALMLKSGVAPLHFWTPLIVKNLSYFSMFLFFTFQKLVPMFIIFSSWFWLVPILSLMNIMIGSISAISQSSLVKMLLFSSIANTGWMIMTMMQSLTMFLFFFLNYTILSFMMMKLMKSMQIKWIIQISSHNNNTKFNYLSIIMSMSGYPPFMGFAPKWLTIKYLYKNYSLIIMMSILASAYMLYFYLKSTLNIFLKSAFSSKWFFYNSVTTSVFITMNISGPLMFFIIN